MAGVLYTVTAAANNMTQNKINPSTITSKETVSVITTPTPIDSSTSRDVNDPFSSAFGIDSVENIFSNSSVTDLLTSNYYLHIIILYLLNNLIIVLLCDLIIEYNWKLLFIKNIFTIFFGQISGERFYNLVIKSINYIGKMNKV
jgi:hypothetical protein